MLLLKRLRSKLASLVAALTAKQAGAPITKVTAQLQPLSADHRVSKFTTPSAMVPQESSNHFRLPCLFATCNSHSIVQDIALQCAMSWSMDS